MMTSEFFRIRLLADPNSDSKSSGIGSKATVKFGEKPSDLLTKKESGKKKRTRSTTEKVFNQRVRYFTPGAFIERSQPPEKDEDL